MGMIGVAITLPQLVPRSDRRKDLMTYIAGTDAVEPPNLERVVGR